MNVIRDCPEARWLPSRYRFALPRLIALLRLRHGKPPSQEAEHLVLSMDRDQSAAEHYSIAIWLVVTACCYFGAFVPLAAAIPLAIVSLQLLTCIVGLTPLQNNVNVNSALIMTIMLIASSYFGAAPSLVRYVAWFFFAMLVLNAAAWIVLMLLRDSVRQLEQQCGT